jgi:hypothetical protein
MNGANLFTLVKFVAILVAALIIGNWFLAETRRAKLKQQPWYKPYLTVPGLIILAALSLPLIWLFIS